MANDKGQRASGAIKEVRKNSDRMMDRSVLIPMKVLYDAKTGHIVSSLRRMVGSSKKELTPALKHSTQQLVRAALPVLGKTMGSALKRTSAHTLTEGVRSAAKVVGVVTKSTTPLDDLVTAGRIVVARQATISDLRDRATEAMTSNLQRTVVDRLDDMEMEGATTGDLLEEVADGFDGEWWQVERLVKTETSYAFNLAQADGLDLLAQEGGQFSGLRMRWTELVSDDGAPLDAAVADDSLVLHGQLRGRDGFFIMPDDPRAPEKMVGMTWPHPPNRPHDRAVLSPWMPEWDIPAWYLLNGARVDV